MLKKIDSKKMGTSNLGWLISQFHFSFADYYNPDNIHFGALRVINDDLIAPKTGFNTHPHQNMEIISYVVQGELSHADSMGNTSTLYRGEVQYMSAGTGVSHSEHNHGDKILRLLQIWVLPDQDGHKPNYGEYRFPWSSRENQLLHLVSGQNGNAPIKVHQDVNFYVIELDSNGKIDFEVKSDRQCYLVQIEGESLINDKDMNEKDGLESVEENLHIQAKTKSHILFIEMAKS